MRRGIPVRIMCACAAVLATDRFYPAVYAGCAGMREVEMNRMRMHKFLFAFSFASGQLEYCLCLLISRLLINIPKPPPVCSGGQKRTRRLAKGYSQVRVLDVGRAFGVIDGSRLAPADVLSHPKYWSILTRDGVPGSCASGSGVERGQLAH